MFLMENETNISSSKNQVRIKPLLTKNKIQYSPVTWLSSRPNLTKTLLRLKLNGACPLFPASGVTLNPPIVTLKMEGGTSSMPNNRSDFYI